LKRNRKRNLRSSFVVSERDVDSKKSNFVANVVGLDDVVFCVQFRVENGLDGEAVEAGDALPTLLKMLPKNDVETENQTFYFK